MDQSPHGVLTQEEYDFFHQLAPWMLEGGTGRSAIAEAALRAAQRLHEVDEAHRGTFSIHVLGIQARLAGGASGAESGFVREFSVEKVAAWPAPVADAYIRLCKALEGQRWAEAAWLLKDFTELVARFCAVAMLSELGRRVQSDSDVWPDTAPAFFLRPTSLGGWLHQVATGAGEGSGWLSDRILEAAEEDKVCGVLASAFACPWGPGDKARRSTSLGSALEELRVWRNTGFAHGILPRGEDPALGRELVVRLKALEKALREADSPSHASGGWLGIRFGTLADGRISDLTGWDAPTAGLQAGQVCAVGPAGQSAEAGAVPLAPLGIVAHCPDCSRPEWFLFDGVVKRDKLGAPAAADFRSFTTGHVRRMRLHEPGLETLRSALTKASEPERKIQEVSSSGRIGGALHDAAALDELLGIRLSCDFQPPDHFDEGLRQFLANPDARCLWIQAPAGVGKSVFVESLRAGRGSVARPNEREALDALLGEDTAVLAFAIRREGISSGAQLIEQLKFEVADRGGLGLRAGKRGVPVPELGNLAGWLGEVSRLAGDRRILLVIDGLDELTERPEEILEAIPEPGSLPELVRLVLTSRPEGSASEDCPALISQAVRARLGEGDKVSVHRVAPGDADYQGTLRAYAKQRWRDWFSGAQAPGDAVVDALLESDYAHRFDAFAFALDALHAEGVPRGAGAGSLTLPSADVLADRQMRHIRRRHGASIHDLCMRVLRELFIAHQVDQKDRELRPDLAAWLDLGAGLDQNVLASRVGESRDEKGYRVQFFAALSLLAPFLIIHTARRRQVEAIHVRLRESAIDAVNSMVGDVASVHRDRVLSVIPEQQAARSWVPPDFTDEDLLLVAARLEAHAALARLEKGALALRSEIAGRLLEAFIDPGLGEGQRAVPRRLRVALLHAGWRIRISLPNAGLRGSSGKGVPGLVKLGLLLAQALVDDGAPDLASRFIGETVQSRFDTVYSDALDACAELDRRKRKRGVRDLCNLAAVAGKCAALQGKVERSLRLFDFAWTETKPFRADPRHFDLAVKAAIGLLIAAHRLEKAQPGDDDAPLGESDAIRFEEARRDAHAFLQQVLDREDDAEDQSTAAKYARGALAALSQDEQSLQEMLESSRLPGGGLEPSGAFAAFVLARIKQDEAPWLALKLAEECLEAHEQSGQERQVYLSRARHLRARCQIRLLLPQEALKSANKAMEGRQEGVDQAVGLMALAEAQLLHGGKEAESAWETLEKAQQQEQWALGEKQGLSPGMSRVVRAMYEWCAVRALAGQAVSGEFQQVDKIVKKAGGSTKNGPWTSMRRSCTPRRQNGQKALEELPWFDRAKRAQRAKSPAQLAQRLLAVAGSCPDAERFDWLICLGLCAATFEPAVRVSLVGLEGIKEVPEWSRFGRVYALVAALRARLREHEFRRGEAGVNAQLVAVAYKEAMEVEHAVPEAYGWYTGWLERRAADPSEDESRQELIEQALEQAREMAGRVKSHAAEVRELFKEGDMDIPPVRNWLLKLEGRIAQNSGVALRKLGPVAVGPAGDSASVAEGKGNH